MAEDLREDVVDVDLHLHDGADVRAGVAVHRDHRLHAELKIGLFPKEAGIDRARGGFAAMINRRRSENSTSGMTSPSGLGRPISSTCCWRYGRLYSSAKPTLQRVAS